MDVLELFNSEMGAFRVRLLRKGEPYGLMHQLTFDDDEPAVEFYGPAVEGEQLRDTTPIGRNRVSGLLRPRDEWRTLGPDGYCSISPENSREIAGWLARELERPWVPPPPPPPPRSQARANRPVELNETGDRRVTFYVRGGIGYTRKEAQWVRVYRRPHAQYADAIFVDFLARGKRRPRRMILTYKPYVVILLGWDHPELQERLVAYDGTPFGQPNSSATAFTTKYPISDPRYDQEFESALDAYLTSLPLTQLLLDLRGATVTVTSRAPGSAQRSAVPVFERSGVQSADASSGAPGRATVFVSYHHGGDADARELFERENGAVIRSSSIYPGETSTGPDVRREIRKRVAGCDFVVVLVGRGTHARHWVDWEIHAALTCGTPKPLIGILLPELTDLAVLLSRYLAERPGELPPALLKRSDDVSRELLDATGTTLPARLLDNLLSGYATLIPWPASPGALQHALRSAAGHTSPVTRRRLLPENRPLPDDTPPVPEPAPQIPSVPGPSSPGLTLQNPDIPGRPLRRHAAAANVPPPRSLPAADLPAWLIAALREHGLEATLTALDALPEHRTLAATLRRHGYLLAPLDSETSAAATLLARLSCDRAGAELEPGLEALLRGPYLKAVSLPDLPSPGLIEVLGGGGGAISALATAPDGSWLASVTVDGVVRIWDITAGTARHVLSRASETGATGHPVLLADTSGTWLACGRAEGLIEVWDPRDGTLLRTFQTRYGGAAALAAPADGAWLAAADAIGVTQVWSLPSGERLMGKLTSNSGWSGLLIADPGGRWLATADGSRVHAWDVATGTQLHEFWPPGHGVSALAIDPRGPWIFCAGLGGTVRMWSMPGGLHIRDFTNRSRGTGKRVTCLTSHAAGRWLAAAAEEGTIRIFSPTSDAKGPVLAGHEGGLAGGVTDIAAGPGGVWLASAGADSTVRIWDPAAGRQRCCFTGHTGGVRVLTADPAGRWLASGGADGTVRLWDPEAQVPGSSPASRPVTVLAGGPAARWFAYSQSGDTGITLRDVTTQAERNMSPSHEPQAPGAALAMAADPRGTWLASAGQDGAVSIWDPHGGSERHWLVGRRFKVAKELTTLMVPAPDGRWLACSGKSPKIRIWSPITGERLNTLWAAGGEVKAVVIDSTGTWLAVASADGAIRLWTPDAAAPYRVLDGHQGTVNALAVAPSGTWLASCGQDSSVRLWNLENDSQAVLPVPAADRCLAVSPDGSWLASAGGDQAIRVWDPADSARYSALTGHDAPPAALAPDPTGLYLCSVAADATIRIWEPSSGRAVASSRVDGALDKLCWIGDNLIAAGPRGVYHYQLASGPSHSSAGCRLEPA